MQRCLLTFSRGEELRFVGHLDVVRLWQRSFRRAGIDLAYSQGFSPHPRMSFASPLPVGLTARADLLDVTLLGDLPDGMLKSQLEPRLPAGLAVVDVAPLAGPSLAARLRLAEFCARLDSAPGTETLPDKVRALLQSQSIPRTRVRDGAARHYDLRPLIDDIWIGEESSGTILGMRLRADSGAAGRSDEILAALGLDPHLALVERTRLILSDAG